MQGLPPPDVLALVIREAKDWGFPAVLLLVILFRLDRTLFPLLKEYIQSHAEMASALKIHSERIGMISNRMDESSESLHKESEGLGQLVKSGRQENKGEIERLTVLVGQVEANTRLAMEENRQTLRAVQEISRALKKVQVKEAELNEHTTEGV